MSLSAKRFQGKKLEISLEEALFEEGYEYYRGQLEDIFQEPGYRTWDLSRSEIDYILAIRENTQLEEILERMPQKSRGATWMAKQVYHRRWQHEFSIETLCADWSAVKELRNWEACNRELCKKLDVSYGKLMHLGIRFAWQADRFCSLYEQVYVANRPWGSCYQVNHHKVKAIALTPNYNRLPLWVKKAMISAHEWIPMEGRIGNIWELRTCAKAWKHCPELPKSLAKKVGRLSVKARILSKFVWFSLKDLRFSDFRNASECDWVYDTNREEFNIQRPDVVKAFWQHLNQLLSASYLEVLEVFAWCQYKYSASCGYKYETDRFTEVYFGLPHKSFNTYEKLICDHDFIESYMQRVNLVSSPEYQRYLKDKEEKERQEKEAEEMQIRKSKLCSTCRFYSWESALPCAVNPVFFQDEVEQCFDWEQK